MMPEYIEHEKLAEALNIWQRALIEDYGPYDEYVRCLNTVLHGMDNIPAADVRPVVLCKHCKYWKRLCNTSHFVCTYVHGVEFVRSADDFCSRGEKRECDT